MGIITSRARAYVNHGRWIAECPVDCGCALKLKPGQAAFHCPECGTLSDIEWPGNSDEIWEVLNKRIAKKHRNWFPSGHTLALRGGLPHGQTVEELEEETRVNSPS